MLLCSVIAPNMSNKDIHEDAMRIFVMLLFELKQLISSIWDYPKFKLSWQISLSNVPNSTKMRLLPNPTKIQKS